MLFMFDKFARRLGFQFYRQCYARRKSNAVNETHCAALLDYEQVYEQHKHKQSNETKQLNRKLLKVALLGLPNAGKSSIINRLVTRSVCPTSLKIHTTKHNADAVFTEGSTQVVFIDTPGVLSPSAEKKYNAENNNNIILHALRQVHVIGLIQDLTDIHNRNKIPPYLNRLIARAKTKAKLILIFNKIDKLKQKQLLLEFTKTLTSKNDLPKFQEVFMLSALEGDGIDELKEYLLDRAEPGEWKYSDNNFTDQKPIILIEETVRAKLLDALPNELPYKLKVRVTHLEVREDGSIASYVEVDCPTERIVRLLTKYAGGKIRTICQLAEQDLRSAFQNSVNILLGVKRQGE